MGQVLDNLREGERREFTWLNRIWSMGEENKEKGSFSNVKRKKCFSLPLKCAYKFYSNILVT